MHGEANFVQRYEPRSVLDAGCGTGRVAIELVRHGIDVVGVDLDASMLDTASSRNPEVTFLQHDVTSLDLGRTFDVVVMAGNVPLFTPPGTQGRLVAGCARHLNPGGMLIAGFQLQRGYTLSDYDEACTEAGLVLLDRFATWDREPFSDTPAADYAVSVHTRPRPS